MTGPEKALWKRLRCEKLQFRFRRQYPAGPYFLDFYCPELKLAIEVDGSTHEFSSTRDLKRDEWLRSKDIHVLRVDAYWIGKDMKVVVDCIRASCHERADQLIISTVK